MIYYDEILYKQAQLKAHYNYYNRQNYNNLSDVEKECFHKVMFLLEQVNELKEAFKCCSSRLNMMMSIMGTIRMIISINRIPN